jgi:hypothetical protein
VRALQQKDVNHGLQQYLQLLGLFDLFFCALFEVVSHLLGLQRGNSVGWLQVLQMAGS